MNRLSIFIFVFAILACSSEKNVDLYLPDDLEATLWAESPMLYNPTNMDVDARGRIWVTEAVNYRNFNNDSLRHLHFSKGDRVMILEDTDNDGVADSSKVFVQDKDLVSPLGIAVLGNKVYVSCSPNLIVYTDTNGDDVPDSKEIFLTGFGGLDHDHSLHSVSAGPDGNLYFNTGNAGPHEVTDKGGWTLRSGSIYTGGTPYNLENQGNMKSDDGKVWVGGLALRINPDGTGLAVLAHNFRNSYEVVPDSYGNLWQNDNDDQVVACRTTWVMEGGNAGYFSTDGTRYWQGDQRPWQDTYSAHWHQHDPGVMPAGDKTGAGSPTGVTVYEGDALGKQYLGMLLSADAGRNVIFGYRPVTKQSGYDLGSRENFITSLSRDTTGYVWHDTIHYSRKQNWFRPSDVTIGTDGAIYVADWYDPIVGGHEMKDSLGYGRIYRIAPRNKKLHKPDLDFTTTNGLIEVLKNPAVNVRFAAFQKLKEQGDAVLPEVKNLLTDENPYIKSRAIFLLAQLGDGGRKAVHQLLSDSDDMTRVVALRALRQVEKDILPVAAPLVQDRSSWVRREAAVALGGIPFEKTKPLLLELIRQYDGADPWMLETIGTLCEGFEDELLAELISQDPTIATQPEQWSAATASLLWRLHPPMAIGHFKSRVESKSLSESDRDAALTAIAFTRSKSAAETMLHISQESDSVFAERAAYWLAFRQGNDWFSYLDWKSTGLDAERQRNLAAMKVKQTKMLEAHQAFDERERNAQSMARDAIGGQMLINLMAEGKLPEDMIPAVSKLIFNNPDLSVRIQAATFFTKEGEAISYDIKKIVTLAADVANGRAKFETQCASCHKLKGIGMDIGPDLTQINKKFDKTSLLDAIINPSAGIVFGYEPWLIEMKDGSSYFGFLVADGKDVVVLRNLAGKSWNLDAKDIRTRKKQDKSLMPEPNALDLTPQALADITEYLITVR